MKRLKYIAVLLAVMAMSVSFTSCSKDVDPDVDAKQFYSTEFTLTNAGSLSAEGQAAFNDLVDVVIWGSKGAAHTPRYCTQEEAIANFNAVTAISNAESDLVQKIIKPIIAEYGARDFAATLILTGPDGATLGSKEYRASDAQ
ncbi:MAG: hypothetical protein IJ868_05995 [Prevotella sp.]|nr:hypothetical protein [Prevotella sp.]